MRGFLMWLGVVAVVLILLGLLLKVVKWLLIVGLIALAMAILLSLIQSKRGGPPRGR